MTLRWRKDFDSELLVDGFGSADRTFIYDANVVDRVIRQQPQFEGIPPRAQGMPGDAALRKQWFLGKFKEVLVEERKSTVVFSIDSDGDLRASGTSKADFIARSASTAPSAELKARIVAEQPFMEDTREAISALCNGGDYTNKLEALLKGSRKNTVVFSVGEQGQLRVRGNTRGDWIVPTAPTAPSEALKARLVAEQPYIEDNNEVIRQLCNNGDYTRKLEALLSPAPKKTVVFSVGERGQLLVRGNSYNDYIPPSGASVPDKALKDRIVAAQPYLEDSGEAIRALCNGGDFTNKLLRLLNEAKPVADKTEWRISEGKLQFRAMRPSGEMMPRWWVTGHNDGYVAKRAVETQPQLTYADAEKVACGPSWSSRLAERVARVVMGCSLKWTSVGGELRVEVNEEARGEYWTNPAYTEIRDSALISRVVREQPQMARDDVASHLYSHGNLKDRALELLAKYGYTPVATPAVAAPKSLVWRKDGDGELIVEVDGDAFLTGIYPRDGFSKLYEVVLADKPQIALPDTRSKTAIKEAIIEWYGNRNAVPAPVEMVSVRWAVDSEQELSVNGRFVGIFHPNSDDNDDAEFFDANPGVVEAILRLQPKLTKEQTEKIKGLDREENGRWLGPLMNAWYRELTAAEAATAFKCEWTKDSDGEVKVNGKVGCVYAAGVRGSELTPGAYEALYERHPQLNEVEAALKFTTRDSRKAAMTLAINNWFASLPKAAKWGLRKEVNVVNRAEGVALEAEFNAWLKSKGY